MPLSSIWFPLRPIIMLIGSNVFMTTAWYGHLRFKEVPLFGVIVASWLIAFVEYCLAVPANRFGSAIYSTAQLKTVQEVITLVVFAGFSVAYLREPLTCNYAIGFVFIAVGAYFVLRVRSRDNDLTSVALHGPAAAHAPPTSAVGKEGPGHRG